MGFDSDANRIANEAKLIRGNLVYAYAALRALAAWKPATFTLRFDGADEHTFTGYAVAAANSKAFGGGMFIAPDADLEDGQFDVVMTGDGRQVPLPRQPAEGLQGNPRRGGRDRGPAGDDRRGHRRPPVRGLRRRRAPDRPAGRAADPAQGPRDDRPGARPGTPGLERRIRRQAGAGARDRRPQPRQRPRRRHHPPRPDARPDGARRDRAPLGAADAAARSSSAPPTARRRPRG